MSTAGNEDDMGRLAAVGALAHIRLHSIAGLARSVKAVRAGLCRLPQVGIAFDSVGEI